MLPTAEILWCIGSPVSLQFFHDVIVRSRRCFLVRCVVIVCQLKRVGTTTCAVDGEEVMDDLYPQCQYTVQWTTMAEQGGFT